MSTDDERLQAAQGRLNRRLEIYDATGKEVIESAYNAARARMAARNAARHVEAPQREEISQGLENELRNIDDGHAQRVQALRDRETLAIYNTYDRDILKEKVIEKLLQKRRELGQPEEVLQELFHSGAEMIIVYTIDRACGDRTSEPMLLGSQIAMARALIRNESLEDSVADSRVAEFSANVQAAVDELLPPPGRSRSR